MAMVTLLKAEYWCSESGPSSKSPPFKRAKSTTLAKVDLMNNGKRIVLCVLHPLVHGSTMTMAADKLLLQTATRQPSASHTCKLIG